jgi:hypothetical protein
MGLLERIKRIFARPERPPRPRPRRRRRDPDWSSLPGGSSAKEASEASPQRAGELAD